MRDVMTRLVPALFAATVAIAAHASPDDSPLVFISAFAPGPDGAIHGYRLDVATGRLSMLQRTTGVENPFFLAISPDRKHLYSIHAPGQFGGKSNEQVAAYELMGHEGELKLLNRQSSQGTASCYLDVDSSGSMVVVANYSTGSVASYPIRKDGSIGEASSFVQHHGSSVDTARQEGPHAHSIVISPDNRFAFAADLGLDQILCYRIDPKTAKLLPSRPSFVRTPPRAGPRHLIFHPNAQRIYVINELENSVTQFDYEAASGSLIEQQTISTLPKDFDGKSYCADLKITPNGKFLYGTNRGHDSIAAYRIADDGRLTLLGIHSSGGKGPQNLAITAGGELLLCANMPGNNVTVFRIDANTGDLTPVGESVPMPSPSCIRIVAGN